MTLGNNESMAWRHWIAIKKCYTCGCLADNVYSTREAAERTGLPFPSLQLVEMVILINLKTLVCYNTLIRQFDITLICVLLVDGMKAKAFFC